MCVWVCVRVRVCYTVYKNGSARNAVVTPLCKAVWDEQGERMAVHGS